MAQKLALENVRKQRKRRKISAAKLRQTAKSKQKHSKASLFDKRLETSVSTKMAEFDSILSSINESAESLKTLYFRPPGIFTNALILKPDITTLLRDADVHESSLYNVDKNGITERKDGSRGVVDTLNYEFDQLELQQLSDTMDHDHDAGESGTKPAVLFVHMDADHSNAPEVSKGVKNLLNRFNEENLSEYEFETLCSTVRELLEK